MKKLALVIFVIGITNFLSAQMRDGDFQDHRVIDSVTVSGTAIVDETIADHPFYYLDKDNDGIADYRLNFGPYWYSPDSSAAVRPADGDQISVLGGLRDDSDMQEQTIIVYELNGEFWRDPYFADWNDMGRRGFHRRFHRGGMMGYGFGWMHDSLTTVSVSGVALVDTTYFMDRYYLDTDNDGAPNYFLNFGPFWYEPESGAVRPSDGQQVEIVGGTLVTDREIQMLLVFEIDGQIWRDSSKIGEHFGGGWFTSDMNGSRTFYSPFDYEDNMTVHPGWNQDGGHGHMGGGNRYSDSLFCQLFEIDPVDIITDSDMNVFAGYEVNMFTPDGNNAMLNNYMMGGHMSFGNEVDFNFHYTDLQMSMYDGDERSIEAKFWDDQSQAWTPIAVTVDAENNSVTINSKEVGSLIVLTAAKITSVDKNTENLPVDFQLMQNYPNPFNPSTSISFTLNNDAQVTLNVYNVIGAKVATILNGAKSAGAYNISFNASGLSSGIYFYELKVGGVSQVRKMNLLK